MGRELKRVALDFDWPLRKRWEGYLNPHYAAKKCEACGGTGKNPEVRKIEETFYSFDNRALAWRNKITQDEVNMLWEEGRLRHYPECPSATTVNLANGSGGDFFHTHDAINRWLLVEYRARALGVWGEDGNCHVCKGEGYIWPSAEAQALYENWEATEPPLGEGYQVWETVSEGSPISPVFPTKDDLINWLIGEGYSEGAAEQFAEIGHAFSAMIVNGRFYNNIEGLNAAMDSD